MGGSRTQTTTQESTPWVGQQPYLTDLFSQSQNLYNQGPQQYYPGQTVAAFSPQTQMGMDLMTQRALSGSPQQDAFGSYLTGQLGQSNVNPYAIYNPAQQASRGIVNGQSLMQNAGEYGMSSGQPNSMVGGAAGALQGMTGYGGLGEAQQFAGMPAMGALPASTQYAASQLGVGAAGNNQLAETASGGYLGSNPYLDQMFDTASQRAGEAFNEQTMPAIAAQFGSAGRTGSGIHQQVAGNAARQFGRDLQGMAADIYAPAYESERDRMQSAAGAGSQAGLGAANLGVNAFGQYNQADLGRRSLGSELYLGERGLGQSAASNLGQLGLGQAGVGLDGANLGLQAGQGLGQLGMSGVGAMGDLYGNIAQNQFRAGSLVPSYNDMQYGDISRLLGVGGMVEDQAQRYMDANQARWNFGQSAPWMNLNNYANAIYGLPGGYGTQTSSQPGGSRLQGALGGAMSGMALGPWGALGGAVLGGIL